MILYSRSIYIKENDAESKLAYYVTLDCYYIRQKKRKKEIWICHFRVHFL